MSRDVAISQTAAAMLAWFQQQLSNSSCTAVSGTKASSTAAVQAAASAAHVPLASVGLNAAGLTAGPLTLGPSVATESLPAGEDEGKEFGQEVFGLFKGWVTSPLTQQEVEFTVKGFAGL
jgi:hypothetical protein